MCYNAVDATRDERSDSRLGVESCIRGRWIRRVWVKVGVLDSFFRHEVLGIGFGMMIEDGQHFAHLLLKLTQNNLK
jgi:hypothetical protein